MATVHEYPYSRKWWEALSTILKNLQTWWLVLIGSAFVLVIVLIYESHWRSSDVERLTLISAGAVFLAGMILSTINTERKALERDDPFIWLARIRCVLAIGLAVIVGFAAAHPGTAHPTMIASVGVLTAGAAWIVGLLLGFIFGLPQAASKSNANDQQAPMQKQDDAKTDTHPPTNLEQIADWLTKLILGAGLTQLSKIPAMMNSLGTYVGQAMGDAGMSDGKAYKLFALAIIILFSLWGFLFGYLWGRLFMPGAFRFTRAGAEAGDRQNTFVTVR